MTSQLIMWILVPFDDDQGE